jgi:hypothetical protein
MLHEASQDEGAVLRALERLFDHRQRSSVEVMDYLRQLISPQIALRRPPEISYSDQALARCISAVSASDAGIRLPLSGPWMKRQNSGLSQAIS